MAMPVSGTRKDPLRTMEKKPHLPVCTRTLFFLAVLLLFTLSACRTAPLPPPPGEEALLKAEIRLGEKLLDAFKRDRAEAFLKLLPEETRKRFTEKDFKRSRADISESMGEIRAAEYLTLLKAPGFHSHLWKVSFERKKTLDAESQLRQETLFRIVTVPREGAEPFLLTFGFL